MARPKGKDFFPHLGIWRWMMTTVKLDRGWTQPRIISARMLSDTLFTQLWGVKLESSDLSASERAVGSIWCFLCWIVERHEKWEQPGRRRTTWRPTGCCLGNGSLSVGNRDDSLGANSICWMTCGGSATSAVDKKAPKKRDGYSKNLGGQEKNNSAMKLDS